MSTWIQTVFYSKYFTLLLTAKASARLFNCRQYNGLSLVQVEMDEFPLKHTGRAEERDLQLKLQDQLPTPSHRSYYEHVDAELEVDEPKHWITIFICTRIIKKQEQHPYILHIRSHIAIFVVAKTRKWYLMLSEYICVLYKIHYLLPKSIIQHPQVIASLSSLLNHRSFEVKVECLE